MSVADQEYLLSVENREAVVKTLQAKIIERDDDNYDDEQYGEEEPPIYYND